MITKKLLEMIIKSYFESKENSEIFLEGKLKKFYLKLIKLPLLKSKI